MYLKDKKLSENRGVVPYQGAELLKQAAEVWASGHYHPDTAWNLFTFWYWRAQVAWHGSILAASRETGVHRNTISRHYHGPKEEPDSHDPLDIPEIPTDIDDWRIDR